MNYYSARQLGEGAHKGAWHYTVMHDGHTHAIGFCAAEYPCPSCNGKGAFIGTESGLAHCSTCKDRRWLKKTEAQRCWHNTADEARACYKRYLIENAIMAKGNGVGGSLCQMPGCQSVTKGSATLLGGHHFVLCENHQSIAALDTLVKVGDVMSSY